MRMFRRIKYYWWKFSERYQRSKRGYAWVDVWNMEDWFMRTAKPMLVHLKENGMSYPMEFKDRDEWCAVLDEMIACLDFMDEDKVYTFLGFSQYEDCWRMTQEDIQKVYEMRENNKNRFFELFSKHFYDLWD